jgi:DNA-binding MarR family transcriptional regulator/predicted GNAT family acetyltransferase
MDQIAAVRRFNRTVSERIGALDDEYLARGRPLGASRVLWEVGDGVDVRALRARLGLDSGYLSRLLRALERDGLVSVGPSADDGRVRLVRRTADGDAEVAVLDARSDDLARSLLSSLDGARRDRLVAAMAEVERLLTAGLVDVRVEPPTSADARACLAAYVAELDERFPGGFDTGTAVPFPVADMTEPAGLLLVGRLRGEPIACVALRFHGDEPAEVKRLWVSSTVRGLGVGRRMLAEVEAHARAHGVSTLRLDTNAALTEAIALYRSSGWVETPRYNDEVYAHHWFEKDLAARPAVDVDRG